MVLIYTITNEVPPSPFPCLFRVVSLTLNVYMKIEGTWGGEGILFFFLFFLSVSCLKFVQLSFTAVCYKGSWESKKR